jgi:outer membrane lipoprotein-sorting protein
MRVRTLIRIPILLLALLPLGGCLFRSHSVERKISSATLKEATKEELIERINSEAAKIQTVNATVDISPAVGGSKKGKVTEYQEIRGYILVRKPAMLRMIGLFPIVRNRAFDMVSNGETFKVSIPVKNRFIIGRNDVIHPTGSALENIRPQHIFDALLLREIDTKTEVAFLEAGSEEVIDPKSKKKVDEATYEIGVADHDPDPNVGWYLSRRVIFSREDLLPHRQIVYDKFGNVATDAKYDDFQIFDGVNFPSTIDIWRPQEEYSIILKIVKLSLNQPLEDAKFELPQPAGAEVVRLDLPAGTQQNPASDLKSKDKMPSPRPEKKQDKKDSNSPGQ